MKAVKITLAAISIVSAAALVAYLAGVIPASAQFNWGFNNGNIGQFNQGTVINEVNTNSNTGGNTNVGGVNQSTTTGDATSVSEVSNTVNTNIVNNCDCTPTPTQKPGDNPTPTPGGNGGNGGNGGPGNTPSNPGDGRSDGAGGVGGPAVLGLSTTSGENELFGFLKMLPAFGSMLAGYALLRKNS